MIFHRLAGANWLHISLGDQGMRKRKARQPAANQRVWSLRDRRALCWLCHFCTWPTPVGNIQIRARLIRYWSPPAPCMVQHDEFVRPRASRRRPTRVRVCADGQTKGMINRSHCPCGDLVRRPPLIAPPSPSQGQLGPLRIFSLSSAGGGLADQYYYAYTPRCQRTSSTFLFSVEFKKRLIAIK